VTRTEANITVKVDVTNPGQFFACCGLLELADRLWPGAEGWFEDGRLHISSEGTLEDLLRWIDDAELEQLDPDNDFSSPMLMRVGESAGLTLNWWTEQRDEAEKFKPLKVWAGSMRGIRIAVAMQKAIVNAPDPEGLFDYATVVYEPDDPKKKVEPFYFDARRGRNAQSIDIGFAPDSLRMTTAAFPAVEFLCIVGLQRFRPAPTDQPRVFRYFLWTSPLYAGVAAAAACGALSWSSSLRGYEFESAFRTDQRKHKSFLPATPIGDPV